MCQVADRGGLAHARAGERRRGLRTATERVRGRRHRHVAPRHGQVLAGLGRTTHTCVSHTRHVPSPRTILVLDTHTRTGPFLRFRVSREPSRGCCCCCCCCCEREREREREAPVRARSLAFVGAQTQRAGRAGRTREGLCLRLFTRAERVGSAFKKASDLLPRSKDPLFRFLKSARLSVHYQGVLVRVLSGSRRWRSSPCPRSSPRTSRPLCCRDRGADRERERATGRDRETL